MHHEARSNEPERFGAVLRRMRLERNLTQEMLAERASLSIEAVSALERGVRRTPQRETLRLLAAALALAPGEARAFESYGATEPRPRRRKVAAPLSRPQMPLEALIGRERELAALALAVEARRIVTIAGMGGVGKTSIARALLAQRPASIVIELAPISPEAVAATAAAAFGVHADAGTARVASLVDAIGGSDCTVLLDNCEHVPMQALELAEALALGCGAAVITTSRQPLGSRWETVYRLDPLEVPPSALPCETEAQALAYAAVRLFARRAAEQTAGYTIGDANAAIVADICRRLDGNPLAIELAARRVRVLPPREMHGKLDGRLRLLSSDARRHEPRHRTLDALVGWSFDLLDARERAYLASLGVFRGPFTAEAAGIVAGLDEAASLDVLDALIEKSLVAPLPDAPDARYRLLETIGLFARRRLESDPHYEAIRRRFVGYTVATARARWDEFERAPCFDSLAPFEADDPNATAAFEIAVALGDADAATTLVMCYMSFVRLVDESVSERVDRVLAIAPAERDDLHAVLRLKRARRGGARSLEGAWDDISRALVHARRAASPPLLGWVLAEVATAGALSDRLEAAERAAREADALPLSAYARNLLTMALGLIATYRDERERAVSIFRRLVAVEASLGNAGAECTALINLAEAEFARGDVDAAIDAAVHARRLEPRVSLTSRQILRSNFAGYCVARGEFSQALSLALAALGTRAASTAQLSAFEHAALALVRLDEGNATSAARVWGYARAERRRLGVAGDATERATEAAMQSALASRFGCRDLDRHVRFGEMLAYDYALALASNASLAHGNAR